MADQSSTLAKIAAAKAEAQAIGAAVPTQPPGTGVLANLARGYARSLGSYVNPDPDWSTRGRNITDYSGGFADPKRHQFLLCGGEHGPSLETDIRAFNTLTGAWSSLYPSTKLADMTAANLDVAKARWINTNQPQARHTYNLMVVRGDELWLLTAYTGKIARYDLASVADPTTRWTFSAISPPWFYAGAGVLDPVSNNVYVFSEDSSYYGHVWKYDPAADTWAVGPGTGANTQPNDAVYCPQDDKFYTFEHGAVVRRCSVDRSNLNASTAQLLATAGPKPSQSGSFGYPSFTWDNVNKRMGGCFINGVHYEFDPVSLLWSSTTVQLEAGSTGPCGNDFFASAFMEDVGCYVFVQIHPTQGPITWAYRP